MLRDVIIPKDNRILYIFFGGKGGVGKSTLSAATAVYLADAGYRTLLISADLQMSLSDIFEQLIEVRPTTINGVPNLWALNTDVSGNIAEHQLRQIKTMESLIGTDAPEFQFLKMHYQKNACCETASWNRMTEFMNTRDFRVLVFDTAPGGHSLQALRFPIEQAQALNTTIQTRLGIAEITGKKADVEYLEQVMREAEEATRLLRSDQTRYQLVMHPERLPLLEGVRMMQELEADGIRVASIVINGILPEKECRQAGSYFQERWEMQQTYIKRTREKFAPLPVGQVPLLAAEVIGVDRIRQIANAAFG